MTRGARYFFFFFLFRGKTGAGIFSAIRTRGRSVYFVCVSSRRQCLRLEGAAKHSCGWRETGARKKVGLKCAAVNHPADINSTLRPSLKQKAPGKKYISSSQRLWLAFSEICEICNLRRFFFFRLGRNLHTSSSRGTRFFLGGEGLSREKNKLRNTVALEFTSVISLSLCSKM